VTLSINGQQQVCDDHQTITQLLESLRLQGSACAVEVNKQLIPKARHTHHILKDGDAVEIVTLVGGG